LPTVKITKRAVDALKPSTTAVTYFDTEVKGFGVRVMPSGTATYVFEYRANGGGRREPKKRLKIERVGAAGITPDQAREKAIRMHRKVLDGDDPAGALRDLRAGATISELVERFLTEEIETKRKASTATLYRHYAEKHIIPHLGTSKAATATFADLAKAHAKIGAESPVTANRVMNFLSGLFAWALKVGERSGDNPAKGHQRFREQAKERFLSADEMRALGDAIREAETIGVEWKVDRAKPKGKHIPKPRSARTVIEPEAAAAIRLLLFTGARLREILHLKWSEVDLERGLLLLGDSKTGRKPIVLNAPAATVLSGIPRKGLYVIKGAPPAEGKPERPRADLKRPWALVTRRAGLEGLRIHDLRHSFASFGAGGGMGLPVIGRLLGHKSADTTQRYAHLADDPVRRAAETIGAEIAGALGEPVKAAEVVKMRRRRT
jgi:integrase